ncbi:uncharacterized protein, partial [Diabrotica undecimpunctata]|uniref:uncharacterized protein n=1 Tax=Diabrotica undecimpunctata TaxID=50387 RepID=UPI003B638D86
MPRVRNKEIRSQWSNQQLESAVAAVMNGMSYNAASQRYNISRRTLKRYVEKNCTKKAKMGRKTILNIDQENELSRRIVRLAEVGYPLSNKTLKKCVFTYCEQNNLPHFFSQGTKMAGRYWLKGFLQRHPEISIRKAQNMNPARAQKLNKFIVKDYFDKLRGVLQELDLIDKPERIYNVDEKGCRLSLHHQQTVLAKKGAKRVHLVAPEHGENVTIVSCANANGTAIPPAVLFKGRRMKPEWKDNLPHGTLALMTPKGSMNVETFIIWLEHLAKYKLEGKCLLIFDGASCHLDISIVEAAEKYQITLLCLPSNTTHELQPMDKAVFRSFEHHWDEQVLLYWTKYKERALTKQRFGEIFSIVWDKALTPSNIKSGFAATGIFPYNPDAIPEVAFAPSILSEIENIDPTPINVRQKTPSPTPGCSYNSSQQKRVPNYQKTQDYKKKKSRTETSSSDSDSGPINVRQKTPSPTPGCSYNSSQQKSVPKYCYDKNPGLKITTQDYKKKKPRTESSSSDSDSGPINLRQKTPPPTAGYSKSSSQQNCLPQYQKTPIHMKKKSKTQTSSSESSGSYTSESEDSGEEVELAINQFHKKKETFLMNSEKNDLEVYNKENNNLREEKSNTEEIKTCQGKTLDTSFTEMLETPAKIEKKNTQNRKKAINSRAIV